VDPCTWSIIVTAAAVVVLPLVLLMVTVMLLAVASLVIPAPPSASPPRRARPAREDRHGAARLKQVALGDPGAAVPGGGVSVEGGVSHENHPAEVSPGWL
jgi:hypothetical protein